MTDVLSRGTLVAAEIVGRSKYLSIREGCRDMAERESKQIGKDEEMCRES